MPLLKDDKNELALREGRRADIVGLVVVAVSRR
jgi:hypothetical protein